MSTFYKFNIITAIKLRNEAKRNDKLVSTKSEQLQTSCINSLEKLNYKFLHKLQTAHNALKAQITRLDNFLEEGDKYGRKIPMHFPILSASEISRHRKAVRMNYLWMTMMVLAEVGLYYIVSPFFIPTIGGETLTTILRLAASFVFAIAIMFAISIGYNLILEYIEAKHLHKKQLIEDDKFENFKSRQRIGIVLVVFGFGAILVMAVIRHLMLKSSVNPNLISDDILRNSTIRKASSASWAAIFACALAIIFGILLAISKNEAQKYAILYKVMLKHGKELKILHKLIKGINEQFACYKKGVSIAIKKACDLVLHLKRLAKRDVDVEFNELSVEFNTEKRKSGFVVDKDVYGKFRDIISKDKDLFLFPILNSDSDLTKGNLDIKGIKDDSEVEYKNAIAQHSSKGNKEAAANRSPLPATALFLLIGFLFAASSCTKPVKNRLFLMFPDASGSIDYNTKIEYKNNLRQTIAAAKPGDKIILLPIDAGTVNNSTELATITVPDQTTFKDETDPPQEADILQKARFDSYLKNELAKFDSCIVNYLKRSTYRNGTDIIGAFDVAMLYKVDTSKFIPTIIIMSDGLNCSPELNLEKGFGITQPNAQILDNHKNIDLKDWHVFFLTGNNPKMSAKRYLYAKTFWLNFLKADHAREDNVFYASGANTVLIEKLKGLGESHL
ncbi:hypothetical protein [Mucilaginibacter sp. UYCu711]|uniref:hypothetical protein n=1 Tax=Mucilaginibacter sp. UYCu711 TaxID=3156339 RepID=UPI003D1EE946